MIELTVDKAGRVVLPKKLRLQLRLEPGDKLGVERQDENVVLKPIRPSVGLKKEHGVWVYRAAHPHNTSIVDLIDQARAKRIRELSE